MNLLNNISMQAAFGSGSVQKPAGSGVAGGTGTKPQQGVMGFLSLVLGQGGTQNAANIGDLAAKVAQLLKANPTDQAGLQKLIESFAPNTSSDLSAQIAQALQNMAAQGPQAKPGLISDLTAMLVGDLQQADQALDPAIMAELQQQFNALQNASPEALAKFKSDMISMLEGRGLSADKIQQYMDAFAKTQQASAENMQMGATAKPAKAAQNDAIIPTIQTQQPAPQVQAPKTAPVTSNLALINGMASGDQASFGGEFGQQGSFSHNNFGDASGMVKHASDLNTSGFINYMSAAKGTSSAMLQMVNLQIQRNAAAKIDTFTLQLDPAELGRLDIQLKFDHDGGVKAHLTADRPETLAMLQRDSSQLEKMLQQAGLDIDGSGLSFDLREQGKQAFENEGSSNTGNDGEFASHVNGTAGDAALSAKIAVEAYGYITQSGVNILV